MGDIKENDGIIPAAVMTVEQLNAIVEAHKKDLYVFQEKFDTQQVLINKLQGSLLETKVETREVKKLTVPTKLVTVEGVEYKWNLAAFNLGGQVISAEDASLDEDILRTIIAIDGQGILTEQV